MSKISGDVGFEPIHWPDEAIAVICDVQKHVRQIVVSTAIPFTELSIYLNCETKDSKRVTVRLSSAGFQVVGHDFDTNNISDAFAYETPYALLSDISSAYVQSFADGLSEALLNLKRSTGDGANDT